MPAQRQRLEKSIRETVGCRVMSDAHREAEELEALGIGLRDKDLIVATKMIVLVLRRGIGEE